MLHAPIGEVVNYTPGRLYDLHKEASVNFDDARKTKEWVESAIDRKYQEKVRAKRSRLEKDTGTIHIEDDGFRLTSDVPKKVEWDQGKLRHIIAELLSKGANIDDLVSTTYHISERRYTDWPSTLQSAFVPARTVKHSKANNKLSKLNQLEVSYE